MDQDTIYKIVGQLYIQNYLLGQKNENLSQEVLKLRSQLEKVFSSTNGQDGT